MSIAQHLRRDATTQAFLRQATLIALELEVSAKLREPLPANTDFTEAEDNGIQSQVLDTDFCRPM